MSLDLDAIKARPPVWHGPQGARVLLTETERDALVAEVKQLREALEQIATWDYRGHPHPSAEVARNALGEPR